MSLHPSAEHVLQFFDYDHLRLGLAREASARCAALAQEMVEFLGDDGGPEFTVGLRKLLEAKDCFVREAIVQGQGGQ